MTLEPRDPMDDEIDRALSVEPSVELLRRVRSRIAEEPARRGRWVAVGVFAAGTALGVVLIGLRLLGEGPRAPVAPTPARLASTTISPPPAHAPWLPPAWIERAPTRKAERVRAADTPDEAEVLVPLAERESLQRLLRAASREPLVLASADKTATDSLEGPPAPIVVPPIVIERLVPDLVDEGDSK